MPHTALPSKPTAQVSYRLQYATGYRSNPGAPPLMVIFLNNLMMPAASWEPSVHILKDRCSSSANDDAVPILTYDRFGQGATADHDPRDADLEPGYGHDLLNVVHDLHELITAILPQCYPHKPLAAKDLQLLLVGASIGAPMARLYAETYPKTVSGMVLLDSNMANSDYSSYWPDPDAPDFNPGEVTAPDCTVEQYREACNKLSALFDPSVQNSEHLDRRSTPVLLPSASEPKLYSPNGGLTKLFVVGHDPDTFAQEMLDRLSVPMSFTKRWVQSRWDFYNNDLLDIGDSAGSGGHSVRVANRCGHFIQRDDPAFVAGIVDEMLKFLVGDEETPFHWSP